MSRLSEKIIVQPELKRSPDRAIVTHVFHKTPVHCSAGSPGISQRPQPAKVSSVHEPFCSSDHAEPISTPSSSKHTGQSSTAVSEQPSPAKTNASSEYFDADSVDGSDPVTAPEIELEQLPAGMLPPLRAAL